MLAVKNSSCSSADQFAELQWALRDTGMALTASAGAAAVAAGRSQPAAVGPAPPAPGSPLSSSGSRSSPCLEPGGWNKPSSHHGPFFLPAATQTHPESTSPRVSLATAEQRGSLTLTGT